MLETRRRRGDAPAPPLPPPSPPPRQVPALHRLRIKAPPPPRPPSLTLCRLRTRCRAALLPSAPRSRGAERDSRDGHRAGRSGLGAVLQHPQPDLPVAQPVSPLPGQQVLPAGGRR